MILNITITNNIIRAPGDGKTAGILARNGIWGVGLAICAGHAKSATTTMAKANCDKSDCAYKTNVTLILLRGRWKFSMKQMMCRTAKKLFLHAAGKRFLEKQRGDG